MSALYVHHLGGYSKTHYKKLVTHVESHMSTVSLLESEEHPTSIKTTNKPSTARQAAKGKPTQE